VANSWPWPAAWRAQARARHPERARAGALLPPSLREADLDAPQPGRRYRIDREDGTWWELGWDRPLGTYYAQRYGPQPQPGDDSPLDWKGTGFGELPDLPSLEEATGVRLPHAAAVDLAIDRAWLPNRGRPAFLDFAEEWSAREDAGPDFDADDPEACREAALDLRRRELDRRAEELTRRERQLASQADALRGLDPVEPRWSLPVEPVIRLVGAQQRATGDDLRAVATGFALDSDWVLGVMAGDVTEVDLPHVQQICEGVHCSPYDLWGEDDARTVLHAFPPELWPRHIEPLQDDFDIHTDPSPGIDL
jgi:hypothetical protein